MVNLKASVVWIWFEQHALTFYRFRVTLLAEADTAWQLGSKDTFPLQ